MATIDQNFLKHLDHGEKEAFDRVKRLCYSCINSYTRDHEVTEELVPVAIDKIVDALANYNPEKGKGTIEANFRKWIRTIAFNTYLDFRERKKREVTFSELATAMGLDERDQEVIESDAGSLENLLSMEAYKRYPARDNPLWNIAVKEVIGVMNSVDDSRKKKALLLKFVYGLTTSEVADIMHENFDSIQTVIHRATKELRNKLLEKGINADYLDPATWRAETAAGPQAGDEQ